MIEQTRDSPFTVTAGPVNAGQRYAGLDTLRGVAVLGILVMNVYAFAMPFPAYYNPLILGGTGPLDLGTWFFTHILFDQKFLSIFAMLFGAGIVLMSARTEARGIDLAPIWYRRMFWLLLLGAAHAYLLWFGDILFPYALLGMLVYPLRRLAPRRLIRIALFMLPVAILLGYAGSFYVEGLKQEASVLEARQAAGEALTDRERQELDDWENTRRFMAPTAADIRDDIEAYRDGYADIVAYRAPGVAMMQLAMLPFFGIWRIGALMLLGMALMKLGVFSGERSSRFYRRMMFAGYGFGLPLTVFSGLDLYAHDFDRIYVQRYGSIANYAGSIVVAFGHVGLVMLVVKLGYLRRLTQRFAAVGRMALTNYLLHSVILTTVFYGYGLGLFGRVSRFSQMGFVIAVMGLELLLSPLWLRHFRFGPAEWFWRSATYWHRQPMRRRESG